MVQPHIGDFPKLMLISQVQTGTRVLQANWIWASSSLGAIWLDYNRVAHERTRFAERKGALAWV